MGSRRWEGIAAGRFVAVESSRTHLPPRRIDRLIVDGEVVAENARNPFFSDSSTLFAAIEDAGHQRLLEAQVSPTLDNQMILACHILLDGHCVGGDAKVRLATPALSEWEATREQGLWRYIFRVGLAKYGFAYALLMTLFFVLGMEVESPAKIAAMFVTNMVLFGGWMGWFTWRSNERESMKSAEARHAALDQ